MAENNWKWLKITGNIWNGWKLLRMTEHLWIWLDIAKPAGMAQYLKFLVSQEFFSFWKYPECKKMKWLRM